MPKIWDRFIKHISRWAKNNILVTEPERKCVVRELKHNSITWIDVENPNRKQLAELAEKYDFHPLHLRIALHTGQLDQLYVETKYLFLLLRSPKHKSTENKIPTDQVCFFLGKNFLVTTHHESHNAMLRIFKECESSQEKREAFFKKSSGSLLYKILKTLIADISKLLERLLQEADEIENLVFDVNTSGAYQISQLRQKITRLRKVMTSLKNIVTELVSNPNDFTSSQTRYFKNALNVVSQLREALDEAKETVEIYKDADFTVSTEHTNKILGILTIIFTLAIPAQIIGSFYGMNILIPGGLEAGSWTFWGPFTTFYFVIAITIAPIALMLTLFKFKKWI